MIFNYYIYEGKSSKSATGKFSYRITTNTTNLVTSSESRSVKEHFMIK